MSILPTEKYSPQCGCCTSRVCPGRTQGITRRGFMAGMGSAAAGTMALSAFGAAASAQEVQRIEPIRVPLVVQPVFTYGIATRQEGTSWRSWGGIHTEQDAAEERDRITRELDEMKQNADFPVEIRPVAVVRNNAEAANVVKGDHDVLIMYASGGGMLETLTDPKKWTIIFLRHKSGPVYLWYEIIHNRFLRKTVDEYGQIGVNNQDVVVDRHDEVLWRLRALAGLKNTLGKKILCIGGASGWGDGGQKAPQLSKDVFKMNLVDVSYDELVQRIARFNQNASLVKKSQADAKKFLSQDGITLETAEDFVAKCFLLTEVFHELMAEHKTDALTINACMGTIMQVSKTTACMPLNFLNDDGYMAFCESDFVVIPSGILLHYISGKPQFFNDPTYPHDNVVTLAHCTAPRKMDGVTYEPARILTHFESDWGAAPKVEMKLGQKMTVIDPDFNFKRWLGFEAEIIDNPFLDICRSQIDVQINGSTEKLNEETRGFHWMACYDNYLKETGYALSKVGIEWLNLTV
ncbi:MAG TPA: sugar isomerase [bacterium]|nr:sugar isomerase [bacterium]